MDINPTSITSASGSCRSSHASNTSRLAHCLHHGNVSGEEFEQENDCVLKYRRLLQHLPSAAWQVHLDFFQNVLELRARLEVLVVALGRMFSSVIKLLPLDFESSILPA